ncbi:hypothetical protein [Myroides profundi]|uniref:Long-chain fatty acid transport protein n=1 Tax=Myroides profundi TaxID=480520 RepID=A0AAJ5BEA3_MYRPR|nr:hypothetical protein [Myroides profundi]AJH13818.1 hypothetical protein MPR_0614 [Myroides profundi]SER02078.1 Long-chain fatty acid transport protein [Myroides profundi]
MIKKIFFSLSLLCGTAALAQQGNASPYSYYGVGNINYNGTNEYKAMGGTNVYADSIHINLKNPASFGKLKLTTFSLGATGTSYNFKTDAGSENANRQTIDYVAVGLPIAKNFGVVFGLLPYSNVGYKINGERTNPQGQKINSRYEGDGGVNRVFLGAGYEINKNFAVGVDAGYHFGHTNNDLYENITDIGDGTSLQNITRELRRLDYKGFSFNFSAQYTGKFKGYDWQANVTYSPETKWTNDNLTKLQVLKGNQIADQKTVIDESRNITNPQALSMGLGFGKEFKWFIGGQYTFTQTSKLTDSWNKTSISNFENSNRFSLGGFYIPKYNSFSSYLDRVVYRAGFRYENTGLILNDKAINDMAVNLGVGLPIGERRKFTNLNIGFEYGSRGTKNNGLVKENYFSVYVGFSLNDLWFQKRRFD